jgi:hypothetical protein
VKFRKEWRIRLYYRSGEAVDVDCASEAEARQALADVQTALQDSSKKHLSILNGKSLVSLDDLRVADVVPRFVRAPD